MTLMKKLHLWLSVPFGLVIFITCFSGAMLVFEKEITAAIYRELYTVEQVGEKALPLEQLAEIVSRTLDEGVEVTGITVFDSAEKAYQVKLSKPKHASVYVNQYTGEVKGSYKRLPFFATMFRLHRWLMDPTPNAGVFVGKTIVGISTLVFVVILITGLVVWFPRSKKMLRNRLTIKLDKGWRRFWYDLHVAGGFYALVVLLAMALTGLTWSFPWYRTAFYNVFGVDMQKPVAQNDTHNKREGRNKADRFASWQSAFDNVKMLRPEASKMTVAKGEVSVTVDGWGNQRASDKYKFSEQTGEIVSEQLYVDSSRANKLRGWIYSVHVGSFGGIATRIIAFLVALFGASLPLTGYYLWIRRLYVRK